MGDEFDSAGWDLNAASPQYYDDWGQGGDASYQPSGEVYTDEVGQMWIIGNDGSPIHLPASAAPAATPNAVATPEQQGGLDRVISALLAQQGKQGDQPAAQPSAAPSGPLALTSADALTRLMDDHRYQAADTPYNEVPKYDGPVEKSTDSSNAKIDVNDPKYKELVAAIRAGGGRQSAMNNDLFDDNGNLIWQKLLGLGLTGLTAYGAYHDAKAKNAVSRQNQQANQGALAQANANQAVFANRMGAGSPVPYATDVAQTNFRGAR